MNIITSQSCTETFLLPKLLVRDTGQCLPSHRKNLLGNFALSMMVAVLSVMVLSMSPATMAVPDNFGILGHALIAFTAGPSAVPYPRTPFAYLVQWFTLSRTRRPSFSIDFQTHQFIGDLVKSWRNLVWQMDR